MGLKDNCLIELASKKNRRNVIPSDVYDSLQNNEHSKVEHDLLEVLVAPSGFKIEVVDMNLCIWIAWEGLKEVVGK